MLNPRTFWVCSGTTLTSMSQKKLMLATGVAALPALTLLDLSDNFLSGPLPNDWSRAVQLEFMLLENNAFSGALPRRAQACSLIRLYMTCRQLFITVDVVPVHAV